MSDLIDRQKAIEAMSRVNDSICGQQAIDELLELPSENQWIPVTERLPEYDGWYLCTIKNDIETKVAQIRFFEDIKWKAYGWQVTAWMDEPEPYAESEG